ncbi:hypothetical protein BH24ACT5_BH24ACT5_02580 [soil metagenome]
MPSSMPRSHGMGPGRRPVRSCSSMRRPHHGRPDSSCHRFPRNCGSIPTTWRGRCRQPRALRTGRCRRRVRRRTNPVRRSPSTTSRTMPWPVETSTPSSSPRLRSSHIDEAMTARSPPGSAPRPCSLTAVDGRTAHHPPNHRPTGRLAVRPPARVTTPRSAPALPRSLPTDAASIDGLPAPTSDGRMEDDGPGPDLRRTHPVAPRLLAVCADRPPIREVDVFFGPFRSPPRESNRP